MMNAWEIWVKILPGESSPIYLRAVHLRTVHRLLSPGRAKRFLVPFPLFHCRGNPRHRLANRMDRTQPAGEGVSEHVAAFKVYSCVGLQRCFDRVSAGAFAVTSGFVRVLQPWERERRALVRNQD